MALKNLIDLDHSESVAAGTAVAMLAGPAVNDQLGAALTTITGAIGINPQLAGGISALYALFRLWTKFRADRKAAKAAKAGAVYALFRLWTKFRADRKAAKAAKAGAVVLALVLAGIGTAAAEPGRAIEVGAGITDASGVDEEGSNYSAGWNEPLGKTGRWSGHVALQRLTDLEDALDAYHADADLLANFGLGNRFQFFLGGGLGSVWQDAIEQTVEVDAPAVGKNGSHGGGTGTPTPTGTPGAQSGLAVNIEDEDAYLRFSVLGGFRVGLDRDSRFAIGVQYRVSHPLGSEPEDSMRDQDAISLVVSLPTE